MELNIVERVPELQDSSAINLESERAETEFTYRPANSLFLPVSSPESRRVQLSTQRHIQIESIYLPVRATYYQTDQRTRINRKSHREFTLGFIAPDHECEQFAQAAEEVERIISRKREEIINNYGAHFTRTLETVATLSESEWTRRSFLQPFTQCEHDSNNSYRSNNYEVITPFFLPRHSLLIRDIAILQQLLTPQERQSNLKHILSQYMRIRYLERYDQPKSVFETTMSIYGAISFLLENNFTFDQADMFFKRIVFTGEGGWRNITSLTEKEFYRLYYERRDDLSTQELANLDRAWTSYRMQWNENDKDIHKYDYYYFFILWLGLKEAQIYFDILNLPTNPETLKGLIRMSSSELLRGLDVDTNKKRLRRLSKTLTILNVAVKPYLRENNQ